MDYTFNDYITYTKPQIERGKSMYGSRAIDPDVLNADYEIREHMRQQRVNTLLEEKLAAVTELGSDVHEVGTVLVFKKRYGSKMYTYAAVKGQDKKWHTTASQNNVHDDWHALVAWLVSGEYPVSEYTTIYVATSLNGSDSEK